MYVLLLLLLVLSVPARAADLKVATWNLNWLTTRAVGLPPDVKPRVADDFSRLRGYAGELGADIVALQEVDSHEAANLVFPADRYSVHMSRDRITQKVGIAVRRGLRYEAHPDVASIALDSNQHLRGGVDITVLAGEARLRVLAVHLKTGCLFQKLRDTTHRSCSLLASQGDAVAGWAQARAAANEAFIILGDFNRALEGRDELMVALRRATPLDRATEKRASPCWGGETFIDHILAGGPARAWMRPDTLRVLTYRETGADWKSRLSDHCPVSVRFTMPD